MSDTKPKDWLGLGVAPTDVRNYTYYHGPLGEDWTESQDGPLPEPLAPAAHRPQAESRTRRVGEMDRNPRG